jgi:hypothetical protein
VEYDLSALFNNSSLYNQRLGNCFFPGCIDTETKFIVRGDNYKLNIPIQGTLKNVRHDFSDVSLTDPWSNQNLYYQSFHFLPSTSGQASFIPFSSELPQHYSSLDTSTYHSYLTDALPLYDFTNNSTSDPYLRVNQDYTHSGPNYVPELTKVSKRGLRFIQCMVTNSQW